MKASAFLAALLLSSCTPRGPDPELERQRLELERAKLEQSNKEKCTAQAEKTIEHTKDEWRQVGLLKGAVLSSVNHYNKKLGKCVVEIDSIDSGGSTTRTLLDAYENTTLIFCIDIAYQDGTRHENCKKSDKTIAPSDAHRSISSYLESEGADQ